MNARNRVQKFALAAIAAAALTAMAGLGPSLAARAAEPPAAAGPVLADETFTGATAIPGMEGYGTACLSGAPQLGTAEPGGEHELVGCPAPDASSGNVPPTNAAPYGYLQLTSAATNQAGAALYERPIPSTSGVRITFDQWQYGPTVNVPGYGNVPADGISFFLIDGSQSLNAPGAFGGSLGYAQKTGIPGVNGGYLGIGLDVLGNYFNDAEGRGSGCPTQAPGGGSIPSPAQGQGLNGSNMITVRGPGQNTNGYCYVAATWNGNRPVPASPSQSTLTGQIQGATPAQTLAALSPQAADAALQPTVRSVSIEITPAPNPQVTVGIKFPGDANYTTVLSFAAPAGEPSTYKFGFAASTGDFTDVHLIRNLTIQAVDRVPSAAWSLQKTSDPASGTSVGIGDRITYTLTATNPSSAITDFVAEQTVSDDLAAVLAHATLVEPLPPGLTLSGTTLTWDVPLIGPSPPGGPPSTASISYTVVVTSAVDGATLTNTATPSAPGTCAADACTVEHPLTLSALDVEKTNAAIDGGVIASGSGQQLRFTITVTNSAARSTSAAANITVQDALPAGLTPNLPVTAQPGWDFTGSTASTLHAGYGGTVPIGGTVSVSFTATVGDIPGAGSTLLTDLSNEGCAAEADGPLSCSTDQMPVISTLLHGTALCTSGHDTVRLTAQWRNVDPADGSALTVIWWTDGAFASRDPAIAPADTTALRADGATEVSALPAAASSVDGSVTETVAWPAALLTAGDPVIELRAGNTAAIASSSVELTPACAPAGPGGNQGGGAPGSPGAAGTSSEIGPAESIGELPDTGTDALAASLAGLAATAAGVLALLLARSRRRATDS